MALVIGNAAYKTSALANPVNDARLMEAALKESGFTVIKAENASMRDMRRLVRDFGDKLKASGGVGLFYFAGHGVQVRGENYLVSTDSDIRNEDEVADDALNANLVLEKMQCAGNRMNLVILDACRNNPFTVKSRSAINGLATMSAPNGSMVAYATSPGSVASDGKGKNGLYTEHLAAVIRQPGQPVEEVFKQVRAAVRRDSNNQQTPWENTALEGHFYFRTPAQTQAAAPLPAPVANTNGEQRSSDLAFWESIKSSQRESEFDAYLTQFPQGMFVVLARNKLEDLRAKPALTKPVLAPAPLGQASGILDDSLLGTLVLTDPLDALPQTIEVRVKEKTAVGTTYTTGDAIASDGHVTAVRIGNVVLGRKKGELWKFPLKEGTSGEADIELTGGGNHTSSSGSIKWKVMAINTTLQIDAVVNYVYRAHTGNTVSYGGKWLATYLTDRWPLPKSFTTNVVSSHARNLVSAELTRK